MFVKTTEKLFKKIKERIKNQQNIFFVNDFRTYQFNSSFDSSVMRFDYLFAFSVSLLDSISPLWVEKKNVVQNHRNSPIQRLPPSKI